MCALFIVLEKAVRVNCVFPFYIQIFELRVIVNYSRLDYIVSVLRP